MDEAQSSNTNVYNNTKCAQRIERKKKKVEALLSLAENNQQDKMEATYSKTSNIQETVTNSTEYDDDNCSKRDLKRKRSFDSGNIREKYREYLKQKKKAYWEKPSINIHHDLMNCKRKKNLCLNETGMESPIAAVHMSEVQQMLMYVLLGQSSYYKPKWCSVSNVGSIDQVVFVIIDQIPWTHVKLSFLSAWKHTNSIFDSDSMVRVVPSCLYDSTPLLDLCLAPLPSREIALQTNLILKCDEKEPSIHNVDNKAENEIVNLDVYNLKDAFPRTLLLMSCSQLVEEGYPIPCGQSNSTDYEGFVFSKDKYGRVTDHSPLFAVDCEMVVTSSSQMDLASICVVNEKLEVVYESLVKPHSIVTDYVTQFSGMTSELLENVTTQLEDVQTKLRELLPSDAILCGQSLCNDLVALKMFHPYVIDTSLIFDLRGSSTWKTRLKQLASIFLNKDIQMGSKGHSASEDAVTTMELVLLKLQIGYTFGSIHLDGLMETPKRFFSAVNKLSDTRCMESANVTQTAEIPSVSQGGAKMTNDYKKTKTHTRERVLCTAIHGDSTNTHTIEPTFAFSRKVIPQLEAQLFDLLSARKRDSSVCCGSQTLVPADPQVVDIIKHHKNSSRTVAALDCLREETDLVIVQYDNVIKGEKIQKSVTKIDDHIQELHSALKPKDMMIVLCSGSSDQQGGLFVTIKKDQTTSASSMINSEFSETEDAYDLVYGPM